MPRIVEHIDAIARKKQRDVLYVTFHKHVSENGHQWRDVKNYNYHQDTKRDALCQWLDEQHIAWDICGHIASDNITWCYFGQIYLDIPYDESDASYQLVREYLENPDGTMRDPRVVFCYLTLEIAMKNAHHDEPGYWDDSAENF